MNNSHLSENKRAELQTYKQTNKDAKQTGNGDAPLHPLLQLQQTLGNRAVGQVIQRREPAQPENKTGLPDNLKAGLENLSGLSMGNVKVHYNSPEPSRLQALAYTKGTDIHLAPGQEKHLPHEAWHVVQQQQGRVTPTMQLKDEQVNNDSTLEREADVMGEKASRGLSEESASPGVEGTAAPGQRNHSGNVVQRLRMNPDDNEYYSGASPVPKPEYKLENKNEAFLTATSAFLKHGGGHTSIFVEYLFYDRNDDFNLDDDVPHTWQFDLFADKNTNKIMIKKELLDPGTAALKMASKGSGLKKTWKTSRRAALKGEDYGDTVKKKAEKNKYTYRKIWAGTKGSLNCARFGQGILKAAGIPVHLGFWKLPSDITKPSKTDKSISDVVSMGTLSQLPMQKSMFPEAWRTKSGFLGKVGLDDKPMGEMGKALERYHKYPEPLLRYLSLKRFSSLMIEYVLKRLAKIGKDGGQEDKAGVALAALEKQPWMKFLRGEFVEAFIQEVDAIKSEVKEMKDSPWEDLVSAMDMLQIRMEELASGDRDKLAFWTRRYVATGQQLNFLRMQ